MVCIWFGANGCLVCAEAEVAVAKVIRISEIQISSAERGLLTASIPPSAVARNRRRLFSRGKRPGLSAPATDGFIEKHASKVQMQPKLQRSIVHRRPGDGPKTGLPRVGNRFGELRMIYRVKSIRLEGQSRLFRNWQL